MDALNKFEQLLDDASLAVAILLNPATSDFELVSVARVEENTARSYTARGLEFSGLIGMCAGQPRVALDTPIEGEAAQRIIARFLDRVEDEFNARVPQAEPVDWLQRLWGLKDTRAN